jgi:hypothetical protein
VRACRLAGWSCSDCFKPLPRVAKALFPFLILRIASGSARLPKLANNVLRCSARADRLAGLGREFAALLCSMPDPLNLLMDGQALAPAAGTLALLVFHVAGETPPEQTELWLALFLRPLEGPAMAGGALALLCRLAPGRFECAVSRLNRRF